jgi:hypothetical protein
VQCTLEKLGSFAYSATLPSAQNSSTTIENVKLTIANKGIYCWSYFEKISKV